MNAQQPPKTTSFPQAPTLTIGGLVLLLGYQLLFKKKSNKQSLLVKTGKTN